MNLFLVYLAHQPRLLAAATLSLQASLAQAAVSDLWTGYSETRALAILAVVQLLLILWLIAKLRRSAVPRTNALDPILQKTKFQLHREIARHEVTEELLLETRDYLHCLINSLPTIIIGVTKDGYVTHWNTAAEEYTGLGSQRALGQRVTSVVQDPEIPIGQIRKTISEGTAFVREAIQQGRGADARYMDLTVQPMISPDTVGAVILIHDVTLRVRVERSMVQNEKMLSLGEMAAGLAHEINNPLAAILSNIQTINRRLSASLGKNIQVADELGLDFHVLAAYLEKRDIPHFLDSIQRAGDRAAKIVKTMLEFSHAHNPEMGLHDIADLANQSLDLAANTLEMKADDDARMPFIIRDFSPDLPQIECSASEIQQVLLNLLLNAAQAIQSVEPAVDTPTVTMRLATVKDYVKIEVHDNGPGMPDNVQKHIFEPFFTTKEVGSGTGLGLSVSYFIIKEHHQGSIEVDSKIGKGTRFIIHLPIHHRSSDFPAKSNQQRRKGLATLRKAR